MKKYITFLLLVAAIGAKAQTLITSKAKGDKIWLMPGASEVTPFIYGLNKDTVRSKGYSLTFGSDTTANAALTLIVYNKSGSTIAFENLKIPMSSYRKWGTLTAAIEAYISAAYTQIIKP